MVLPLGALLDVYSNQLKGSLGLLCQYCVHQGLPQKSITLPH